jgi:hypothetical protein
MRDGIPNVFHGKVKLTGMGDVARREGCCGNWNVAGSVVEPNESVGQ